MGDNVTIRDHVPSLVVGTVGTNGTLSEELDLAGYTNVGMLVDNMTNGTINFLVSDRSILQTGTNNYRGLRDNTGSLVALGPLAANVGISGVTLAYLAPYRYVRLLFSIAQANNPTVTMVVKS